METTLAEAGGLADTSAGRKSYETYLSWQPAEGPAGKSKAYVSLSRGWALGTKEFKTALINDHQLAESSRAWETSGACEVREARWTAALERGSKRLGKPRADVNEDRKSPPWKMALAAALKQSTQVNYRWLAEQLRMGAPVAVSTHVGRWRRGQVPDAEKFNRKLEILIVKT